MTIIYTLDPSVNHEVFGSRAKGSYILPGTDGYFQQGYIESIGEHWVLPMPEQMLPIKIHYVMAKIIIVHALKKQN